ADLAPVLLDDDPLVAFLAVDVHVEVFDQATGEVVADEGDVVLRLTDLEDLLAALALVGPHLAMVPLCILAALIICEIAVPATLDVLQDLEADVVRVDGSAARRGRENAGVEAREFEVLLRGNVHLPQDARVPERRPALIHDLSLHLRQEVEHLVADDGADVSLPLFELRGPLQEEEEDVFLRLRGDLAARDRGLFRLVDQVPEVVVVGVAAAAALAALFLAAGA